jgi:hypothetical protein
MPVVGALGLVALGVTCVVLLLQDTVPGSDWATIESRVLDVGTRWTPTEGAWSRYGWNHPGPLVFYALAVPYRLWGSSSDLLRVGGLLISVGFLAVVGVLLHRAGRTAAALGLLAFSLTVFALPRPFLTDYWNPALAVIASGAVLLAAWACLDGWPAGLPVLVATWSWCVQAHLGFGTVLVPAFVIGLVAAVVRLKDREDGRAVIVLSAALGAVMWLPALADFVVQPPGNLSDIVSWALSSDVPVTGTGAAVGFVANATDLARPPWDPFPVLFGVALTDDQAALPGGLVVLLLAAGCAAAALRLRSELHLVVLCLVSWAAAVFAVSRITGELYPWILWWVHPLVACTWLAIGLVALRWMVRLAPALRSARTPVHVGALSVAGLLLVSALVVSVSSDFPWSEHGDVTRSFLGVAQQWSDGGPVVVEMSGGRGGRRRARRPGRPAEAGRAARCSFLPTSRRSSVADTLVATRRRTRPSSFAPKA